VFRSVDGVDVELEMYAYGARYYDPALAKWTSIDPLAEERNWVSPYNYVQNNPIMRVDPTGALDTLPGSYSGDRMPESTEASGNILTDIKGALEYAAELFGWTVKETAAGIDQTQLNGAVEKTLDCDYSELGIAIVVTVAEKATKLPIKSFVKADGKLLSMARNTFNGNSKLSKEANGLIEQLANGNMNPGIDTKSI